jgi:hypothetical protein
MVPGEWSRSLWLVRLGNETATITAGKTRMKIKSHDLSRKDWELCCTCEQEMKQKGLSAHEAWVFEPRGTLS